MNWQTEKVRDWLDDMKILSSEREDLSHLKKLVGDELLTKCSSVNDSLKNLAMKEFLKCVQWEELVITPDAWDDWVYE